jgi:DNA-binding response OmpR family regulator
MLRMDGFEMCRALRAAPATAELPVIMLTVKTSAESVRNALALGVKGYIVKPFEPEGLVGRIRKVLQGVGKG